MFEYIASGALAFGSSNGFWMISSVPKFPAIVSNGYEYKPEQLKFGQTILCVTLKASTKSIIGILNQSHTFSFSFEKKNTFTF